MKSGLSSRFDEALAYASRIHSGQIRKGTGTPYIAHVLGVTALVIEDGGDEDEAIAALLHDAIEDRGAALRDEIRTLFGERVLAIVDGCTDSDTFPKPPWKQRKDRYLASLGVASPEVLRVSTADKLHNVRSLLFAYRQRGEALWYLFNGQKEGTLWYYNEVSTILKARSNSRLTEELRLAVADMNELVKQNG
jgi:GTP pyrophosphokinase